MHAGRENQFFSDGKIQKQKKRMMQENSKKIEKSSLIT